MHRRYHRSSTASHPLRWRTLARAALAAVLVAIGGLAIQSPANAALCAGPASCSASSALFSQTTLDGAPGIGAPTGTNTGLGTSVTLGGCTGNGVPLVDPTYGVICIQGQIPLFTGDPYAGITYPSFGRQAGTGNPWPFGVTVGGTGMTQTYHPVATTPVLGNSPAVANSLALQPAGAPVTSLSVAQTHPVLNQPSSSVANANLPGTVPPVGSASSAYFAAQNNAASTGSTSGAGSTSGSANGQVVCGSGPALAVTASPSSPVPAGQSVTISATAPTGASSPQFLFKALSSGAWKDLQSDWSNSASYTLDTSGYAPGTYDVLVWERDSATASNQASSPYAAYGGVQVTVTGSGASASQDPPSVLPDVSYQGTSFPVNAQCL